MNNFSELLKKRRSTRKFTEEKLSPGQAEIILKAALLSPSSKSSTPWEFISVENKELLEKLSASKAHGSKLIAGCTLAVVVIADPLKSDVWVEDASIASVFIQLQAEDLGLGSCWVQIRKRETPEETSSEEYIKDLLDIPYHMRVLSVIAIGNKQQQKEGINEENLQWEKVHINKY